LQTPKKTGLFVLATVVLTVLIALATGEIVVRVTSPVRTMYPRYQFIPEYGFGLYPNRRIVHAQPGKFEFHYTVNEYGYRGDAVPIADSYATRNIVVLGDSYAFGQGVDDGEPYPAVLEDLLGDGYRVINLGVPGWGLAQEIRRYVEFGALYRPEAVILQYCWNDAEDNLNHMVTVIDDGGFRFQDSSNSTNWAKKYLSGSLIQKSQLYNFYRGRAYEWFQNRHVRRVAADLPSADRTAPTDSGGAAARATPPEEFYCRILDLFAEQLAAGGVHLVVVAVEDRFSSPYIVSRLHDLDAAGRIEYVDLGRTFAGVDPGGGFYSDEGHWGPRAHRLVAEALAPVVRGAGQ
jgi:lysophospholipase L1-like esterase